MKLTALARVFPLVLSLSFATFATVAGAQAASSSSQPSGTYPAASGGASSATAAGNPASGAAKTPGGKSASPASGSASSAKTAAAGSAAQGSAETAQKLTPVVVTATRIAQPISQIGTTVSVVDSEQIQSQQIQSVATVLRQVPGVEVTQSGGQGTLSDISIRGSTAAETLIMVDGVPVNTGATGGFDLANMTTPDLDRIEVLRGAGGALYGSSAIGGVVNLITQEGEGAPQESLYSEGGSFSTQRQVFTLSGAEDRFHYSGGLTYVSTGGYQSVNNGFENMASNVRLDYDLDENTTVRFFGRYNVADVGLMNFSIPGPNNPNAHQRSEFMMFNGVVDHSFTDRLRNHTSVFYVRNDIRLNSYPFPGNEFYDFSDVPDEMRGVDDELTYRWAKGFRTLVGFEFRDRWARSGSFFQSVAPPFPPSTTIFHASRQDYAGYVEQEARLFDGHLLATGGFRVDGNSQFGKEVSPDWAVAIPLHETGTTLRGSYTEGFRAPAFNELYYPDFGNPHLKPEISSEYDGGISQRLGGIGSVTATYFSRRVHDLVVAAPCPTCLFGVMSANAGRVDTQGVEIEPTLKPFDGFSLTGNFTYISESHVSISPSIQPVRVPKYAAFGLAQYTCQHLLAETDQALISLAYTFVGDRSDIETAAPFGIRSHGQYHIFDLVLSYSPGIRWHAIQNEEVFTRMENLFDRNYSQAFGFPSPPLTVLAGVKLDL